MNITKLKGIGEKTAELLKKMDIATVEDALMHFPRTYMQFPEMKSVSEAIEGETAAIIGRVCQTPIVKKVRAMQLTLVTIGDSYKKMNLVWFRMPYMKHNLKAGETYVFYGKVQQKNGYLTMEQPSLYDRTQYEQMEHQLLPVYTVTKGLTNHFMQKMIQTALSASILFIDYLPEDIREKYQLCEYNYALKQIHFPDDMDAVITARKRLVFDELFLFVLHLQYQKEKKEKKEHSFSFSDDSIIDQLIPKLSFPLTGAQKKVLNEIKEDMREPYAMQRLIQGDVGSGKTILAFLTMVDCADHGYQSAIMAPTEVLAMQHYESFSHLCELLKLDIPLILITGSMTAKQKKLAYDKLLTSPNAIIIGTHALIQEKVQYLNLALVITDEQHRFGVKQRECFFQKGKIPHILIMSATPIPRTLAIILYGDLDISVLDEVPAKRLPIKNCVVNTSYRKKAYEFIEKEVSLGHQAYVICPLVEESEQADGENVLTYAKVLREQLREDIQIGILHGQMKPKLKNEVMEQFAQNKIQVLVSTTVVEVGVNVPNATVMMIENAEKFGLAQLHQLRGRVGRGDAQSYCIMINASDSEKSKKRLDILNHSNDGFYIANEDLKLRGPGDFFGIRQSGEMEFVLADIYQDAALLQQAAGEVTRLLEEDPDLLLEKNENLKEYLNLYLTKKQVVM